MKNKLLFLLIVFIAFFLRFYQLSSNPPSLTWDEAAWGYNAYSLGIDGRDEFGKFLPLTYLESFGDFKPPLYAYLTVLPVKLFGLNEFATRFPSAFLGVATVALTFFLVKALFAFSKNENGETQKIALLSSFVLTISPWHILLSRAAFEANAATFFIVLGVLLFLLSVQGKKSLLIVSLVSFVLSMYTFNTARIVSPLLVLGLIVMNLRFLVKNLSLSITALVIGLVLFLPLGIFLTTPQAKLRFAEVNIFSDVSVIQRINQEVTNDGNSKLSSVIHNRRFTYITEYLRHYFDNLDPLFLFIRGDGNPKFSIQDVGQMYIVEIPFFFLGMFLLAKKGSKKSAFIFYWLLVGIVPAATARETPHALRIEASLPTFQILTAVGIAFFFEKISNFKIKYLIFAFLFLLSLFNFLYFFHNYFTHYPREFSGEWQYGYKDSINFISSQENNFDEVHFTESLGRPYIYFLFYKKYDPTLFRKEAVIQRETLGFVHVQSFGKYSFAKAIGSLKKNKRTIYTDAPSSVPERANVLKTFFLLNGEKSLVAYTL